MNDTVLQVIIIIGAFLVSMFIAAMTAAFFIKRSQAKNKYNSLPSGGADRSEFSERLAEKYRNERLK